MALGITRAEVFRSNTPLMYLPKRHLGAMQPGQPQRAEYSAHEPAPRLGYGHGPHCHDYGRAWPMRGLLPNHENAHDLRSSARVLGEHPTQQGHAKTSARQTRAARPRREASRKRLVRLSAKTAFVLSASCLSFWVASPSCYIPPRGIRS